MVPPNSRTRNSIDFLVYFFFFRLIIIYLVICDFYLILVDFYSILLLLSLYVGFIFLRYGIRRFIVLNDFFLNLMLFFSLGKHLNSMFLSEQFFIVRTIFKGHTILKTYIIR